MTRSNIKTVWRGKPPNDTSTMPDFACVRCTEYMWEVFEKIGADGHAYYGARCHNCACSESDLHANDYWTVQRPGERWPRVWRLTKEAAQRFIGKHKDLLAQAPTTAKPTLPCSYSGCTETCTQMHHVAPRSIFEDADSYPVVPLCRAHHVALHQRLDAWKAEGPK